MNQIPKEEYINIYSYESICDYIFDENNQSPKNNDIVLVQLENYPLFAKYCETTEDKFIIVSPRSDLGIVEQELEHPNEDLFKKYCLIDWEDIRKTRGSYLQIIIGETIEGTCNINHKYSIKSYANTIHTFDEIPDNVVKWFSCNVNIKHDKLEGIPFGIADGSPYDLIENLYKTPKDKTLYLNFQENTIERYKLNFFFEAKDYATVRKGGLLREDYLNEMSQHKFVLCPFGNGMDCFRIYEALYMGCIPIIKDSIFSRLYTDLPVVLVGDYAAINPTLLLNLYDEAQKGKKFDLSSLTISYWKDRIKKEKNNI